VAALETFRNDLVKAEAMREDLSSQYSDTRNRAEAAQYSQAIGYMLRSQQAELPDTEYYHDRARKRQQDQATLNLRLLEWENERRKILDTETVVDQNLLSVSSRLGMIETVDVRTELQTVFTARLNLYAELIGNARNQLSRLAALGAAEEDLARVIDEQSAFISEHILWVRSTAPLSPSLISPLTTALVGLVSPDAWRSVWEHLKSDLRSHPIIGLLIIPPVWLLLIRNRFRADLQSHAADAQRSSATGLTPTFRAITLTACLATPIPMLIALLGWRLTSIAPVGEFAYALGKASLLAAAGLFVIEFVRNACQKDGLGEAHFGWDSGVTSSIRRAMRLAKISCLPASFVCLFTEFMDDELLISTLGRAALIIESLSVATIVFELLGGHGALAQMMKTQSQLTWARHGYKIWATALVAMPAIFAFVSAIGFHYTATQLSTRMAATWGVIALMIGLRALAMRWLLVVYRRLAIRRSRERRAVIQARQLAGADGAEAVVTPDTSLELRLSDINDQAQRLIRISATVLGAVLLTVIWHEIMPALGYLNRFTFWENALLPVNDQGEAPRVTLVDLIFGGTWMTVTVLACRNLPGLLDISIFQRLPLDAGARYAASALTQYTMVVIGVAVCFRQVGIGWQSVQWLVAAMTVGLGFGLQEIFANFVSGIILLFERPIRVGDTVTIGTISGTVTRIRIRATTVLDWDNKELIVPNRDFVTGNLVNWTLSNPNLRLVIKVGIAYGSDTRLATRLLEEIGKSHPLTLADPEPIVVFSSFGASSLDFELRVFASGLANFRILRHELHIAIDDSFRENGIEIAFPQQDLHVRSLPASWAEQLSGIAAKAADAQTGAQADTYHERSEPKARKHVA
jgi:potassium efflux system protein